VAVVVPCHRVIRGDGSPGGYRWGLPLKQRLLRREAARRRIPPAGAGDA
jgi:AraC family transcriptional regulator of adaptative response/methylated-DNA-[protein]-cysteine methyltransferase